MPFVSVDLETILLKLVSRKHGGVNFRDISGYMDLIKIVFSRYGYRPILPELDGMVIEDILNKYSNLFKKGVIIEEYEYYTSKVWLPVVAIWPCSKGNEDYFDYRYNEKILTILNVLADEIYDNITQYSYIL